MSAEMTLPKEWINSKLEQLTQDISYGYTAKSTTENVGPHLLRITDIQDNNVNWATVPYCEIESKKKDQYLLKKGVPNPKHLHSITQYARITSILTSLKHQQEWHFCEP